MAEIFDFYVADNRTIKFNPIEPILQEDNGVAVWRFRIPKVLNNIDMSGFAWWFVYINATKQKYSEPLTLTADADDPDNYCIADYTIDYGISLTPGGFTFALEAINANGGGEIIEEWHTKTYSHSVIGTLQGNQAEYSETESDIISALIVQIQQKYNSLVGGATPIPVGAVSAMTDTSKIYLLTTDNNWYYYNGSTWVSGGQYASGIVIDPTLTQSGQAADAKVVGDEIEGIRSDLALFDDGKKTLDVDLQWTSGFINTDGSIDTSVTTYHITRKIDASELNGGIITSDPEYTLYAYRYRKDGSLIFGYKTIGNVTTFNVPTDYFEPYADVILEIKTEGYENVSAHGFEVTNTQAQIDTLVEESFEVPKVVMVDTLVALKDEQFDVMYDNIFVNYRAKDIPYKEIFGNVVCVGMENLIRFQDNTVRQLTGNIRFRNSITSAYNSPSLPNNVLKKAITVNTISASAGSGVTRKVLLIGDSWTAPGKYARELRNLFESEDEPMNVTLLGTLGNGGAYVGPENGYHEGHGAFSSKTFCTKSTYNTYANAFYNPTTETFDFSYYMQNCGYSSVDDVFINLGINDVAEMQDFDEIISYWDVMINSIKAYNSQIKVFIGLCGLPGQYKYGVRNNNCNREKARRLLLHERLISEYGNRESEGLIIVPLHLSIDTEHDFPTVQKARSFRDTTLVDYCTDYVHPNDIAYNKIADTLRIYIKYAETLT